MDDFSEHEVKERLMRVNPAVVGTHLIEAALVDPKCGIVMWDASDDNHSFVEAIHTALGFCGTDTRDEWCVVGRAALIYMRKEAAFKQCEPEVCGSIVYIGRLKYVSVYTYLSEAQPHMSKANQFVVGIRTRAGCLSALGQIQNSFICFAQPVQKNDPAAYEDMLDDDFVEDEPEEEPPPPPKRRRLIPNDLANVDLDDEE